MQYTHLRTHTHTYTHTHSHGHIMCVCACESCGKRSAAKKLEINIKNLLNDKQKRRERVRERAREEGAENKGEQLRALYGATCVCVRLCGCACPHKIRNYSQNISMLDVGHETNL